jgi:hypothetical protein
MNRVAAYLWAGPVSAAALPLVALGVLTGGRARRRSGVLEASGGVLRSLLGRAVPGFPISAITFGHVVLASGEEALAVCRAHERVHVRQYETWGPLFPLLYLAASVAALARGRAAYTGNAFERQAFQETGEIPAA